MAAAKYRALIASALNSLAAAGPKVAGTGGVDPDPDLTLDKKPDSDPTVKKNGFRIRMSFQLNLFLSK